MTPTPINESESVQSNIDWLNSVYDLNLLMDGCFYAGEEDKVIERYWAELDTKDEPDYYAEMIDTDHFYKQ